MMNDKIYRYYKDLPTWSKGVVIVAGTAATVGIIYFVGKPLYKKIFPSQEEKNAQNLIKSSESDIARLIASGMKPTYSESQYPQYADVIYNAQVHVIGGSAGDIEDTLKMMQNDLDVALLISSYGVRQNYDFMIPTEKLALFAAARNGLTHFGVITYQISSVNNDWLAKGITYTL